MPEAKKETAKKVSAVSNKETKELKEAKTSKKEVEVKKEETKKVVRKSSPKEDLSITKEFKIKEAEDKKNTKPADNVKKRPEIVSREKLLEAGTYFGHWVSHWNPKMKQYIYGKRLGIHIIDIAKTQKALEFAYQLLNKMAQKPISFIWVGTKKHAKKAIEEAAARTNSVYVSERWLGGTLTNSQTIFRSVKELDRLEELKANNYEGYSKKEGMLFDKKIAKLQKNLGGIRKLANKGTFPQVMICASPIDDEIAIKEARKKGIKIFTINDTNSNPDLSDFVIPANDDSVKSLTLVLTILADAICAARGNKQLFAYKPNEEIILPEEPKKEQNQTQNRGKFQQRNNFRNNNQRSFNNKERNFHKNEESKREDNSSKSESKKENKNDEE